MAEWVYLKHPDIDTAEPTRFPNDPESLRVYEARGWQQVDPPEETPFVPSPVETNEAEQDIRGVSWVTLQHADTGAQHRFPAEAAAGLQESGWGPIPEPEPKPQAKTVKKKTEPLPADSGDTEKE